MKSKKDRGLTGALTGTYTSHQKGAWNDGITKGLVGNTQ